MGIKEEIQDKQYDLPYHHIPPGWKWEDAEEYELYLRECVLAVNWYNPSSLLDVGCGDGRFLKELGYGKGVDLSWTAVRWGKALGLDVECMDARDVEGKFEMVTAIEVLEHIPDGMVGEFVRILKEKSWKWILMCVPTTVIPVSLKHYRHYDERLLVEHFGKEPVWMRRVVRKNWRGWKVRADKSNGRHLLAMWEL